MDVPQPAVGVLAQPTRARLMELLAELKRPAPTDELAERLALHPNGVRAHLERLQAAGLVERRRSANRRGRPRDEWTIAPDASPAGEPPEANRELVRWLVRAIPPTASRLRDVESVGREIGRDIAPSGGASTADSLRDAFAALGFRPEIEQVDDGRAFACKLGNCPYRDAARENQPVVCALHRGMTRGMLDVIDPQAKLVDFAPRDPDEAGCLIEISGTSAR